MSNTGESRQTRMAPGIIVRAVPGVLRRGLRTLAFELTRARQAGTWAEHRHRRPDDIRALYLGTVPEPGDKPAEPGNVAETDEALRAGHRFVAWFRAGALFAALALIAAIAQSGGGAH